MCGICGIYYKKGEISTGDSAAVKKAVESLRQRGPEFINIQQCGKNVALAHARLAIIDTSPEANQPFEDSSGRYIITYNGEIFNFKSIKQKLADAGIRFKTNSDTEALLQYFILKKEECLKELQGFFAFAIYDKQEQSIFLARDRFGVKPLYYSFSGEKLLFASEMKAMIELGAEKELDKVSLTNYLHLNYIPGNYSVFQNVHKLPPGSYMKVSEKGVHKNSFYEIKTDNVDYRGLSYENAKRILIEKLEAAVEKRLVSDVPLGAFLSGGIDSSIIAALAVKHKPGLKTFSIGFKDEPMFDETAYAKMVAQKHNIDHTAIMLTHDNLLDCLYPMLDYIDEPFADSSAVAVYILCKETSQQLRVALSGDGADEMFAGYNKHRAEYKARKGRGIVHVLKLLSPLLGVLPQSRNNKLFNKFRQINRFAKGAALSHEERYWQWAGFMNDESAAEFLIDKTSTKNINSRKEEILKYVRNSQNFEALLLQDMSMVLTGDMLTKVDMMSMANSLEVRTPFLDHDVVDFVFSLPLHFKIDKFSRKKILKDAFKDFLPEEILHRPKHGFEVPLLSWFKTDLREKIEKEWLCEDFIYEQKIFNPIVINKLKKKLFSANPEDTPATVWALAVFQNCWKKWGL